MKEYQFDAHFKLADREKALEVINYLESLVAKFLHDGDNEIVEDVENDEIQGWVDLTPLGE